MIYLLLSLMLSETISGDLTIEVNGDSTIVIEKKMYRNLNPKIGETYWKDNGKEIKTIFIRGVKQFVCERNTIGKGIGVSYSEWECAMPEIFNDFYIGDVISDTGIVDNALEVVESLRIITSRLDTLKFRRVKK